MGSPCTATCRQSSTHSISPLSSYAFITSTQSHADMQRAWHPLRPFQAQGKQVGSRLSPTAHHSYARKKNALSELCSLQAHLEHARRVDDDLIVLVAHAERAPAAPGVCVWRVSRDESAPERPLQQSNRWRWLGALTVLLSLLCTGPKTLRCKGAHVSSSGCKGIWQSVQEQAAARAMKYTFPSSGCKEVPCSRRCEWTDTETYKPKTR